MKLKEFKDGDRANHRDFGHGTIRECPDMDYVYFRSDKDTVEYFAYRGYITLLKEKP